MVNRLSKRPHLPPKEAYPHTIEWRYHYKTDEFKKEYYKTVTIKNVRIQISAFKNTEKGYRGEHKTDLSRFFVLNEYVSFDYDGLYGEKIVESFPPNVGDTVVFNGKNYTIYEIFPMYLYDTEPIGYEFRIN
jgi:acetyltransferase-like isoleucine patch superfamily enzyme